MGNYKRIDRNTSCDYHDCLLAQFSFEVRVLDILLVCGLIQQQLPRESSIFALSEVSVLLCFIFWYIPNKKILKLLLCNRQIILILFCVLIHHYWQNVPYQKSSFCLISLTSVYSIVDQVLSEFQCNCGEIDCTWIHQSYVVIFHAEVWPFISLVVSNHCVFLCLWFLNYKSVTSKFQWLCSQRIEHCNYIPF